MFKRPPTFVLKGDKNAAKNWNEDKLTKILQSRHQ